MSEHSLKQKSGLLFSMTSLQDVSYWHPQTFLPSETSHPAGSCGCPGNVFTLKRSEWACFISKAFPRCFDETCLQQKGAKMILFSMLLSILLRITPSVQARECKWIYQFLKYKLKTMHVILKNPIQAPLGTCLLLEICYWKSRIIPSACSNFIKELPIIYSFTGLCMKTILLALSSEY